MKALVVDDSFAIRKVLVRVLNRLGIMDVTEVDDGDKAVEQVLSHNFDIILLDWRMPDVSGYNALKEIRAKGKSTPVIMVTCETDRDHIVDAIKAGADGYVIKPFTAETITENIKRVLDKKKKDSPPA